MDMSTEKDKPMNPDKQKKIDYRYIRMARIWAENSYCKRRQVGALLVKDKTIISDGYNGTPSGFPNVCEDDNDTTFPYVLHAEANAIAKVAQSNNSSDGATLYVTASPCIECAKLIIQAGIKRVVYSEKYRLTDGIDLLERAGVKVEFLNEQGWIVHPDPISKEEVVVPSVYEGIYADYAELQKQQGFDLEKYQGTEVTVITYQVLNYPDYPENVTATMMICNDRLIGGDISLNTEDGFMEPLISATAQTFLTADGE